MEKETLELIVFGTEIGILGAASFGIAYIDTYLVSPRLEKFGNNFKKWYGNNKFLINLGNKIKEYKTKQKYFKF